MPRNQQSRIEKVEAALDQDSDIPRLPNGERARVGRFDIWDTLLAFAGLGDWPDDAAVEAIAASLPRQGDGNVDKWAREACNEYLAGDWEAPIIPDFGATS